MRSGTRSSGPPASQPIWTRRTGGFAPRFEAAAAEQGEEVVLRFEGLATVAEVFLNGEPILTSSSMFVENEVDVGALLAGDNELEICCRALAPLLATPRKPRARWRTRLADGNLRFFRTSLLGRAPGFAAGPAPVGPWRPVVLERRRGLVVDELSLRPRLDGDVGVLAVRARVRSLGGASPGMVEVEAGGQTVSLDVADGVAAGELRLPGDRTLVAAHARRPGAARRDASHRRRRLATPARSASARSSPGPSTTSTTTGSHCA